MAENCWYCEKPVGWEHDGELEKNCINCGVLNDRNPYPQKEEKVIPQGNNSSQFNPFLKLPNPLENKEGEIKVGDTVEIIDEFTPPESPKLKSPLVGNVKLPDGQLRAIGLNWTSYYNLAKTLGKDTSTWIGSSIKYEGLKKSTKGAFGHLWSA